MSIIKELWNNETTSKLKKMIGPTDKNKFLTDPEIRSELRLLVESGLNYPAIQRTMNARHNVDISSQAYALHVRAMGMTVNKTWQNKPKTGRFAHLV